MRYTYRITLKFRSGEEIMYHLIDEIRVYREERYLAGYSELRSVEVLEMKRENGFRDEYLLNSEIERFTVDIEKREDLER